MSHSLWSQVVGVWGGVGVGLCVPDAKSQNCEVSLFLPVSVTFLYCDETQ